MSSDRAPGWMQWLLLPGLMVPLLLPSFSAGEPASRPTDELTHVIRLSHQERPYESLVRLENLVESTPAFVPAALMLVERAQTLGSLPALRDWFEALLVKEGPSPERWEALAETYTALGQNDKGLDAAWQAHRLDCPDWHCMQTLVSCASSPEQVAELETTLKGETPLATQLFASNSHRTSAAVEVSSVQRQRAGLAHFGLGLMTLGQPARMVQSLESFESAQPLLDSPANRAAVISYRVYVLRLLGRAEEAADLALEAESLHRTLGDRQNEVQALEDRVSSLGAQGNPQEQLGALRRLISLHHELGDSPSEVTAQLYLSSVQQVLGNLTAANDSVAEACRLNATLPRSQQTPLAPLRQAQLLFGLGQTQEALKAAEEAVLLAQTRDASPEGRQTLSRAYNTRAYIHHEQGHTEKTLQDYERALALARTDDDAYMQAILLQNQGDLLWRMGDLPTGLRRMEQALALVQQKGQAFPDRGLEWILQNNLGEYYLQTGATEPARTAFSAAQKRAIQLGDPHAQALSRLHLALVEFTQRSGDWGLDNAEQALKRFEQAGSILQTGLALTLLGRIEVAKGAHAPGIERLIQAQKLFARFQLKRYEADVWSALSQAHSATGQQAQALASLEQASTLYGELRGWMSNPALESRFFASHAHIYARQVQLLLTEQAPDAIPAALLARSFALGEEARSRSLQRWLDTTLATSLDDLPTPLVSRYRQAREKLNQARDFMSARQASLEESLALRELTPEPPETTLASGPSASVDSAATTSASDTLVSEALVDARMHQLSRLREQREEAFLDVEAEVHRALAQRLPPTGGEKLSPEALLAGVQAALMRETSAEPVVVLAFLLGPEQSYLWRVDQSSVQLRILPPEAEIADQVQNLRQSLAQSQSAVAVIQARSHKLAQTLFGDALQTLPPHARLLILPDKSLTGLPFEALTRPQSGGKKLMWLGREHAITYLTTVQALLDKAETPTVAQRSSPWEGRWLVVGDPRYDREDCGSGAQEGSLPNSAMGQFNRLCFSAQEVKGIARAHGAWLGAVRGDTVLTRERATRGNLLGADLPAYSVLHFATHGLSSSEHPIRSGLVLSRAEAPLHAQGQANVSAREDRFLDFNEIRALRLNASLVVLSACETAEGNFQAGEGIQSLAQAFRLAGSRQVMGSHWKVSDASTAQLMQAFYSQLKHAEVAEALRRARVKLMEQPEWSHPYYWAAFGLVE